MNADLLARMRDPIRFARFLWRDIDFYDRQVEIIRSVEQDDETYTVAGNQLGV